ncbi:MAG TPA: hypothetical protein VF310_15360, partial [Vicinamibacteria bacterium]
MRGGSRWLTLCAAMMLAAASHAWAQSVNEADPADVALAAAAKSGPSPLALGDTDADLVYTPVAPCRIVDTRIGGGIIAGGTQRSFRATGSGFTGQGGSAGSCGIPVGATAVFINMVAVNPAGPGDFRVFPAGGSLPTASILNYTNGLNLANGAIVTICDPSGGACPNDFTIQADVSDAHLVADVGGFFRRVNPTQNGLIWGAAHIAGITTATVSRSFTRFTGATVTVTRLLLGQYEVNFGGNVA